MKTSRTKQIVVGVMLVILTLGFCIVGTGAARPDGRPPMGNMQGFGHGGDFAPDGQGGPGGRFGGGRRPDGDVREAIEALEDGETKTALSALLESVDTAMEKLMNADTDSRAEAEEEVKTARDALNDALKEAGITLAAQEPPEKPEGESGMTPPERPERGRMDTQPQESENINKA